MGRRVVLMTAIVAALAAAAVTALLVNIFQRQQEARNPFFRVVELTEETDDPAVWGKNFPFQYDQYLRTVDQVRTRYGGSEAMLRTPSDADPRSIVANSRLEEDPRLRTMWAGYAFSKDFREERGHASMLEDQTFTERQQAAKQPGACLNCHASTYLPMLRAGNGDLRAGFEKVNQMPYFEARKLVQHPVACIDCHDPANMQLRVTRPAFMEGIRLAKARDGVQDFDVNRDATRQEMRAYVCGQCHVEYYFAGPEKRLTFPWANGLRADEIMGYYDGIKFSDWQHAESGAPALKAQHPEFEMWNQGVHGRSGVTCTDCHMPYMRQGGLKVTDHHIRSPLLNVNRACQTCHRWDEIELRDRAFAIQDRTFAMRNRAMDALVSLINDIKAAQAAGATDQQLEGARQFQRRGQFFLDFIEAENSMGFHADQEAMRILGLSLDHTRQGQIVLRNATGLREGPNTAPPFQVGEPVRPGAREGGR
jgi:nitrite reductase (cytochrome c-552)